MKSRRGVIRVFIAAFIVLALIGLFMVSEQSDADGPYTITFNVDSPGHGVLSDGTTSETSKSVSGIAQGTAVTISPNGFAVTVGETTITPIPESGYTILGWKTSGTMCKDFNVSGNITLTAIFGEPDSYIYVMNYTNDVINSVDVYKNGTYTLVNNAKNAIWNFDSSGYGPFNSFYGAIKVSDGSFYAMLDPNNLKKTIDGKDLSPLSDYNIVWMIPTVYWSTVGNDTGSLIMSDVSSMGTAYAHTIGNGGSKPVHKYIGIGVYLANSTKVNNVNILLSQSGKAPTTSLNVSTFDSRAHNTPGNTMLWNFYQWTFTKMATYMVSMGKNTQKIWGAGYNTSNPQTSTGYSYNMGPYYGSGTGAKVFIENSWGYKRSWLGDTVISENGRTLYAGQNATPSYSNPSSGRVSLGSVADTGNINYHKWISSTWKDANRWDAPKGATGTDNSTNSAYPGDGVCIWADGITGGYGVSTGGDSGSTSGIAFFNASWGISASNNKTTSRLAYYFDDLLEISVEQGPNGTTTPKITKCAAGYEVEFINTPSANYRLKDVTVEYNDGSVHTVVLNAKTLESGSFTMPVHNVVIKPEYEPIKTITLASGGGGGFVVKINDGDEEVLSNIGVLGTAPLTFAETAHISGTLTINDTELGQSKQYVITAKPDDEYFYKEVLNGDAKLSTTADTTVAAHITGENPTATLTAKFYRYAVIIIPSTNGSVTADHTYHADGDTVTLTVHPNGNYRLKDITGTDGTSAIAITKGLVTSTFTMPVGDATITPIFEEIVSIEVGKIGEGMVAISGGGSTSPIVVKSDATYSISDNVATISDIELGIGKTYTITATPEMGQGFRKFFNGDMDGISGTDVSVSTLVNKLYAEFTPNTWSTHVQGVGTAYYGGVDSGSPGVGDEVQITCTPGAEKRFDSIAARTIGTGDTVTLTRVSSGTSPVYSFIMPNASVWIDVVFVDDTVTVSFEMNGHGAQVHSQTLIRGHVASQPAEPYAQFYDFMGWFSDTAFTDEWSFAYPVTDNLRLYAQWEVHEYYVTFMADGSEYALIETDGEGKLSSLPSSPSRSGYYFAGWYAQGSEDRVTSDTVFVEDTTVYAQWEAIPKPITYTVSFRAIDGGDVYPSSLKVSPGCTFSVEGSVMYITNGRAVWEIDAVPDIGYALDGWSVTEGTITSSMTIDVTFDELQLIGIEVYTAPKKLTYQEGETFDPKGLVMTLTYSGQAEWVVGYKGNESLFSFSPSLSEPLKASDKKVTVTYGEMSVQQDITVKGAPFDIIPVILGIFIVLVLILIVIAAFPRRGHRN